MGLNVGNTVFEELDGEWYTSCHKTPETRGKSNCLDSLR